MIAALAGGTLLWLAVLLVYARLGIASAFHPASCYLFFHGLVFVVRPWLGWWYGYSFIHHVFAFSPTDGERVTALLVADMGFLCFMAAVLWVAREPLAINPAPVPRARAHRRYRGSLWLAAATCAPVGIASLASTLHAKLADAGTMVMDPATGIAVNTSGNGYLTDANVMLIPLVVLFAWVHRFRAWSLVPFLLYAAARLVNGGARWTFLMAAASLALAFLYDRRARWFSLRAALLGLAVLVPFTLIGQDRGLFQALLRGNTPAPPPVAALYPLEDENYANQEFLEYLVRAIPGRTGTYGYFLDNLQLLTEPVPRALWPAKPIGPPIQLFHLFDYGKPIGMTMSLPGEGWAQGGWIGVMLWCGLFGWLFGHGYRWFARGVQTEFQVAGYLLLLPLSIQMFRDGTLVTLVRFPVFYLVPLGLWWLIARVNGRRIVARHRPRAVPA